MTQLCPTSISACIFEKSKTEIPAQLRQGEVVTNLSQYRIEPESLGQETVEIVEESHPFAIVLSQDCDLEQDFKVRFGSESGDEKLIPSVLFCQVFTAEQLKGNNSLNSTLWKPISQNKNDRYHFIQKSESSEDLQNIGIPELGIDFKRYFTIPTAELYKQIELATVQRRAKLKSPYLEHLSSRYAYYMSRIGLPFDHASETAS